MHVIFIGDGAGVLLRGLDMLEGQDLMRVMRGARRADKGDGLRPHELGNGQSKLTQAFGITKANSNQVDLTRSEQVWMKEGITIEESDIVVTHSVGIEKCDREWAKKPVRFYIRGNQSVSVRDKQAELADSSK